MKFNRPWYAETATTIPKDVFIVIVRSNPMKHDVRSTAGQDAAKTVVDTLNPNDKVYGATLKPRLRKIRAKYRLKRILS